MYFLRIFCFLVMVYSNAAVAQPPRLVHVKNSFSYDGLPKNWLEKRKILKHLDAILPQAISALTNYRSCVSCKADYYITVGYDSLYIRDRTISTNPVVVWGRDDAIVFNQQYTDWQEGKLHFSVTAHVSVWAADGTERYRLVLTDGSTVFRIPIIPNMIGRYSAVSVAQTSYDAGCYPTQEVIEHMLQKELAHIQQRLQRAAK